MRIEDIIEPLKKSGAVIPVKYNEPLKNYTTFKIGGPVKAMYFPEDEKSSAQLFETLCGHGIKPMIIGNGSNLLADDGELDIIAINTSRLRNIEVFGTSIRAGSGAKLSELASAAMENGLTGLEFAHGIPGTLGGAVVMNAGAYGGEMRDVVYATNVCSVVRGRHTVIGDAHWFSYRESIFSRRSDFVLSCAVHLAKGNKDDIAQTMRELMDKRRESQPLDMPSAGSTFKRPKGGFAAELIERAGLKGHSIGGAQVSPKHAGFIVNTGGATFDDVYRLIRYVQNTVEVRYGISLDPEVRIIRD